MSNTPSDAELDQMIRDANPTRGLRHDSRDLPVLSLRKLMREAIAKWGHPQPPAAEAAGTKGCPMTTTELLPCPFCGAPAHGYAIEPHSHSTSLIKMIPDLPDHPGSYVIEGQCACGSGLIGANEAEVVARWNRREPQAVPAGAVDARSARFHAMHQFLEWNRAQGKSKQIPGPYEYVVFDQAVDLYLAAMAAQKGGA
jgi:hypothetical protein